MIHVMFRIMIYVIIHVMVYVLAHGMADVMVYVHITIYFIVIATSGNISSKTNPWPISNTQC